LARYSARSAQAIHSPWSASVSSAVAVPMLTVQRMSSDSTITAASIALRMRSAIASAPAASVSGRTMPNSSPP
jgi:hypothetical protein